MLKQETHVVDIENKKDNNEDCLKIEESSWRQRIKDSGVMGNEEHRAKSATKEMTFNSVNVVCMLI